MEDKFYNPSLFLSSRYLTLFASLTQREQSVNLYPSGCIAWAWEVAGE